MLVSDANWITTQSKNNDITTKNVIISEAVKGYIPRDSMFQLKVGSTATNVLPWDSSANIASCA